MDKYLDFIAANAKSLYKPTKGKYVHTDVSVFAGGWGETLHKQAKELWLCPVTKHLERATYIIIVDQQAQIYVQGGVIHWSISWIPSA